MNKPSSARPAFPRWEFSLLDGRKIIVHAHTILEAACLAYYENERSKEKGVFVSAVGTFVLE